ncbi:sugar phosphotransferase [Leptospira ilyithenensis]|uniref:Sugar phosphotransferase n=2 Tax=Leptospira ilyithenensis TaxID=2484901 RepID=A0A4R9LLZ4_9LEPT|nr:sugar phosphotransferase [Leptospira ilyithenensis]
MLALFCNKKLPKQPKYPILAKMDSFSLSFWIFASLISLIFHSLYVHSGIGVQDIPNERSLHTEKTKKSGGMVFLPLFLCFLLWVTYSGQTKGSPFESIHFQLLSILPFLLSGVVFFGLLGFVDDLISLSPNIRLSLELLFAGIWFYHLNITPTILSYVIENRIVSLSVFIFLLVFIVNLVNFMDGLDLYVIASFFFSSLSFGFIFSELFFPNSVFFVIMVCLFLALFGFIFYNSPKAKLFMGDSGSLGIGFIILSLPLLSAKTDQVGFDITLLFYLFPVFWVDGIFTILLRSWQKKHIFQAHREHLYQNLTDTSLGKKGTCLLLSLLNLPAGGIYVYSQFLNPYMKVSHTILLLGTLACYLFVYLLIRLSLKTGRKNLA